MKTKSTLLTLLLTIINVSVLFAAQLSADDQKFLTGYEKVRASLAADDLPAAKKSAADLGDAGAELSKSSSLEQARAAFATLSDKAVKLAAGQNGYYVLHCPMANKDWVQTNEKVSNPYLGKEMLGCGEIKK